MKPALVDKILLVIKSPPGESNGAAEGFRMATAMIAMNVLPEILFVNDGVYWLVREQVPKSARLASFSERLKTISDLVGVRVLSDSLTKRNLKPADLNENYNAISLSVDEASSLLAQNDAVIAF